MTDLEQELRTALRSRAAEVPHSPMPRPTTATQPARRGRLLPVAAAVVAAAGIAGAVVALTPDDHQSAPPPAVSVAPRPDPYTLGPGEVYYLISVHSDPEGDRYTEQELWQSPRTTGPYRSQGVFGRSVRDGRVVPSGDFATQTHTGTCYPNTSAAEVSCKQPISWNNPTLEFLATASHDPAVLRRQLHAQAVAEAQQLINDGDLGPELGLSERDLTLRVVSYVEMAMSGNGLPPEPRAALRTVLASLPGVRVREGVADRLGRRGTAYSFDETDYPGAPPETLIFDGDVFLGTPVTAFVHGVAPGLGKAPSRMLR
jgi:hypothetical protein